MASASSQQQNRVIIVGFLLILGVVGWSFWRPTTQSTDGTPATLEQQSTDTVDLTDLKFLDPKELLARLDRHETVLFLDIRPKANYDVEHIVGSQSMPVASLNTFAPDKGTLVVLVSGPEIPNQTLKSIHQFFTNKGFSFAFLRGTITDWHLAGGATISSGDPASPYDYAKVIFINPDKVLPLTETLISPLFLDVRGATAFAEGHIPHAINFPINDLEARRDDIPRQKSLFVYGENDYESYQAGVRLFDLGFFGVRVIRGGFAAWKENKLPIETDQTPPIATPPRP